MVFIHSNLKIPSPFRRGSGRGLIPLILAFSQREKEQSN